MRLGINYEIEKLPIDFRGSFVSLTKKAIEINDADLFVNLYNIEKRFTKPFCFSVYLGKYSLNDGFIHPEGSIKLNLSMLNFFDGDSRDNRITLALFNGLRATELKKFPFPAGQDLKRLHVNIVPERSLDDFAKGFVGFKTMSPILLTNGQKNGARPVLHPATEDLSRGRRDIAIYDEDVFRASIDMSLKGHIKGSVVFEPGRLHTQVIHHTIGDHMRSLGRPQKMICFSGSFKLRGLPEDLYRIYQTGIGFKRNQGFGMLEVS